jgi:hypothetical protein
MERAEAGVFAPETAVPVHFRAPRQARHNFGTVFDQLARMSRNR